MVMPSRYTVTGKGVKVTTFYMVISSRYIVTGKGVKVTQRFTW